MVVRLGRKDRAYAPPHPSLAATSVTIRPDSQLPKPENSEPQVILATAPSSNVVAGGEYET
jgi:hypothetical protein